MSTKKESCLLFSQEGLKVKLSEEQSDFCPCMYPPLIREPENT